MSATPEFSRSEWLVQDELLPEDGLITLSCPECWRSFLFNEEWVSKRAFDAMGCPHCGIVSVIPVLKEDQSGRAQEGAAASAA